MNAECRIFRVLKKLLLEKMTLSVWLTFSFCLLLLLSNPADLHPSNTSAPGLGLEQQRSLGGEREGRTRQLPGGSVSE